ncbi:MAG TPA: hypothetical protein VKU01_17730 [Bryobacteraceae bacterium]|nr:hypothetical protein [Bryobacteraceae bacterium]
MSNTNFNAANCSNVLPAMGWGRIAIGLFVAIAAQAATPNPFVSIVNEVFSDSNSVRSVVCYNGGGSQGPDGLNCNPPGFAFQANPYATVTGNMDTTGTATTASETLSLNSPTGQTAQAYSMGNLSLGQVSSISSGSSGAEGIANVSIQDNAHFVIAGASSTTVTPIQITWTFRAP